MPYLPDGERHRAERADRRDAHDDRDDPEEDVREPLDEVQDGRPPEP